ncbi:MAG: NAD(P)H-binding protein [Pseudonocardiaceae bacterium]
MGATGVGPGNVGRRVAHQLLAEGVPVRALARDRRRGTVLPNEVEVVEGDLARPETLGPAFEGADRMYMVAIDGTDVLDSATATEILEVAKKAGVWRVVLLSAYGTPLVEVEEPVKASGLEWTFLRPGEFAANSVDYWASSIREEGVVRDAYLDVLGVPVHEDDIAAVGVAALLNDGHAGAIYTMTGPESISRRDQIRTIGKAIGRDIRIEDLTPEQAHESMAKQGWPEEIIEHLFRYFSSWVDNPPEVLPTVEKVTGQPARSYAQWCAKHVSDFT